jgi:hypothetical protein
VGLLGACTAVQATLIDAGNGLINDTTQNLVWTQNANLAASNTFGLATGADLGTYPGDSSGVHGLINANGTMNWPGAMLWIAAMNAANYKGYSDWRLWQVKDSGSSGCDFAYANTDCGYNVNTATGELASLWYDTLGNKAYCDTGGNCPQSGWGFSHTGLFTNVQASVYWSGTQYAPVPVNAWLFGAVDGVQNYGYKGGQFYGWAVRPGQVDAAPLPATGLLVALGLMLLGITRDRRRRLWLFGHSDHSAL